MTKQSTKGSNNTLTSLLHPQTEHSHLLVWQSHQTGKKKNTHQSERETTAS